MHWIRRKEVEHGEMFEHLVGGREEYCGGVDGRRARRAGHVPVLVGTDDEDPARFLVHVRLFKDPSMAALLEMAAEEFGYCQDGILRIPCDVEQFRRAVDAMSKSRSIGLLDLWI